MHFNISMYTISGSSGSRNTIACRTAVKKRYHQHRHHYYYNNFFYYFTSTNINVINMIYVSHPFVHGMSPLTTDAFVSDYHYHRYYPPTLNIWKWNVLECAVMRREIFGICLMVIILFLASTALNKIKVQWIIIILELELGEKPIRTVVDWIRFDVNEVIIYKNANRFWNFL